MPNRRTRPNDAAGAFQTERGSAQTVLDHIVGQQRQHPHHVPKIETGRLHRYLDLIRSGGASIGWHPVQMTIDGRSPLQPGGVGTGLRRAIQHLLEGVDPYRTDDLVVDLDFSFLGPGRDDVAQSQCGRFRSGGRRDVDAPDVEIGKFVRERARERP
jgi:hypothetical protein